MNIFYNIKNSNTVFSSRYYGETVARLSNVAHTTPYLNVLATVTASNENFQEYYDKRYISNELIESAISRLNGCDIGENSSITIGISVYKECLLPLRTMNISNNFASIKHTILKLYEAWFDKKPLSYS